MPPLRYISDRSLPRYPGFRIVCAYYADCGSRHQETADAQADWRSFSGILLCFDLAAGAAAAESSFLLVALSCNRRTYPQPACGPLFRMGFALGHSSHAGISTDEIVAGNPAFSGP